MPYKTPTRLRKSAYETQHGQCCYCGRPMWMGDVGRFADTPNCSLAQARWLQCTAEHLHARQEGGGDSPTNVVAACRYCNMKRHHRKHPLPPEEYRRHVITRIKEGKWHQFP